LLLITMGLGLIPVHLGAQELAEAEGYLEEVIVTAEYRPVSVLELPTSVTVFNQKAIERRGAVHLEQLLNLAPNVNLSSGASRGRFVLIRGIGERSQFVEPINPSVGLIIDGMDFTGIGGAASTLDMQQVEILRGPQGTLFGANALAGLINMVSNGPGDERNGYASLTVGNYSRLTATAALGGPVSENTGLYRAINTTVISIIFIWINIPTILMSSLHVENSTGMSVTISPLISPCSTVMWTMAMTRSRWITPVKPIQMNPVMTGWKAGRAHLALTGK